MHSCYYSAHIETDNLSVELFAINTVINKTDMSTLGITTSPHIYLIPIIVPHTPHPLSTPNLPYSSHNLLNNTFP